MFSNLDRHIFAVWLSEQGSRNSQLTLDNKIILIGSVLDLQIPNIILDFHLRSPSYPQATSTNNNGHGGRAKKAKTRKQYSQRSSSKSPRDCRCRTSEGSQGASRSGLFGSCKAESIFQGRTIHLISVLRNNLSATKCTVKYYNAQIIDTSTRVVWVHNTRNYN